MDIPLLPFSRDQLRYWYDRANDALDKAEEHLPYNPIYHCMFRIATAYNGLLLGDRKKEHCLVDLRGTLDYLRGLGDLPCGTLEQGLRYVSLPYDSKGEEKQHG